MYKKVLLVHIILLLSYHVFPQRVLIEGDDSVQITTSIDTGSSKISLIRQSLKINVGLLDSTNFKLDKKENSFFITYEDSSQFYKKLVSNIINDSIKNWVKDSVNKYLREGRNIDLEVSNNKSSIPGTVNDTVNLSQGTIAQREDKKEDNLVLIIAVVSLAFAILLYMVVNRSRMNSGRSRWMPVNLLPKRRRKSGEDNKDETDPVDIKEYNKLKEKNHRLTSEFDNIKKMLNEEQKKSEGFENELKNAKKEIEELNNSVKEKEELIKEMKIADKDFKEMSDKILNKYYTQLAIKLEKNDIRDKNATDQMILQNLLAFTFHSASLLKKYNKNSSASDSLNIELLKGMEPNPTETITENSQYNHNDALAYHVFHLLKQHGVQKLDGVFVHGYKIGK